MSNKIFEIDSDAEVEVSEEIEPVEVSEGSETDEITPASPKVKKVSEAEEKPKKPRKKRPPLTEERKAQLLKNLEAGRKKAMENRQKKAQAKKIIKKKKEEEMDNLIKEDLMAKKYEASEKNKLRDDLDEMKKMMKNLMEENSRLKNPKPLQTIKEETKPSAPTPEPVPIEPPKPKIHRTKGITSRWAKYQ